MSLQESARRFVRGMRVPGGERHRPSRHRGSRPGLRTLLLWTTSALLGLSVVGAPLACGAVHRAIVFIMLGLAAALAVATAILAYRSKADLKPHVAMALPTLFLLVAAAQMIPLPWGLRARIDPAGSDLLALARLQGPQPLSLDPPETYLEFAKSAGALAVGLAALVLSSGRRFRTVSTGLVAFAGIASLVVGLGHRAVSEGKIYGLFHHGRGLLVGPFIKIGRAHV